MTKGALEKAEEKFAKRKITFKDIAYDIKHGIIIDKKGDTIVYNSGDIWIEMDKNNKSKAIYINKCKWILYKKRKGNERLFKALDLDFKLNK